MNYIENAVQVTKRLREEYKSLALDGFERPVDIYFLLMAAENFAELEIQVISVPVAGEQIRSQLRRYEKSAEIIISENQNLCWSRYSVVKEIAHLLFDVEGCFIKTVGGSNALIEKLIFPANAGPISKEDEYFSELFAEYCALELLFPFAERDGCIAKINAGELGSYQVATEYKIPQRLVEIILSPINHERLRTLFIEE